MSGIKKIEKLKSAVMFECLGCGKPFIGSMVVDEPVIITLDDYGFVIVPANPTDLAEKY